MTRWVKAIAVDAIEPGACCVVRVEGLELALARVGSGVYALDNVCPHAGGSIGDGYVVRGVIHCSFHDWPFELATGAGPEGECVKTYPARIADGWIEVEL